MKSALELLRLANVEFPITESSLSAGQLPKHSLTVTSHNGKDALIITIIRGSKWHSFLLTEQDLSKEPEVMIGEISLLLKESEALEPKTPPFEPDCNGSCCC